MERRVAALFAECLACNVIVYRLSINKGVYALNQTTYFFCIIRSKFSG